MQEAARRAVMDTELLNAQTRRIGLESERLQMDMEGRKASAKAFANLAEQLPEGERQLFMADPGAYIKSLIEGYSLSPGQVRMRGSQAVAAVPQAPVFQNVPTGVPGVTQGMWLRPGEASGVPVGGQAMPEILNPAVQAAKKDIARAGKTDVNLAVNTAGSLWKSVADKVGDNIASTGQAAQEAVKTIESANQIRSAIDAGGVIAGPGATLRLKGAQVAQVLGFSGPDAVVNTRNTVQGLSRLALGARAQLKGQGQISDFEGKLLQKAETGDIQDLTIPEIRALADIADRGARAVIKRNKANVDKVSGNPDTGPLGQFLDVQEPPAYQGPSVTRTIGGKTYVKRNGQWFESGN
jgi:hypothetical protein